MRVVYLLILCLSLGIGIVFLRTHHRQTIYRLTCLREQQQQLRQDIWQQNVRITNQLQHPLLVRRRVESYDLDLKRPGMSSDELEEKRIVRR